MSTGDVAAGTIETVVAGLLLALALLVLARLRREPARVTVAGRPIQQPRLVVALLLTSVLGMLLAGVGHLRGGPPVLQELALLTRIAAVVLTVVLAARGAGRQPGR